MSSNLKTTKGIKKGSGKAEEPPSEPTSGASKGWIVELDEAKAAHKVNPSAKSSLRLAKAHLKLRQFEKCEKVCQAGFELLAANGKDKTKRELAICLQLAKTCKDKELSYKSAADQLEQQIRLNRDKASFHSYTKSPGLSLPWDNVFLLHQAAFSGDVRLLEALVREGASIDYPVSECHCQNPAPLGLTALHFACTNLMMKAENPLVYSNAPKGFANMHVRMKEAAEVLIMLGANFQKKIPRTKAAVSYDMFGKLELYGLSAKDMAQLGRFEKVLKAIERMEADPVENVWCRCGSRLPWKQCHASPDMEFQHPHFLRDGSKLMFRYSPLAVCPCTNTKKSYFSCCWRSVIAHYNDDARCILMGRTIGPDGVPHLSTFGDNSSEKLEEFSQGKTCLVDLVRRIGILPAVECLIGKPHPKSQMGNWDKEVYAGVLDRIPTNPCRAILCLDRSELERG